MPAEKIVFGVDDYMQKKDIGNFKSIFKIPFGKYRISEKKQDKITSMHPHLEPTLFKNELPV